MPAGVTPMVAPSSESQPAAAAFVDIEIGVRTAEYHDGIGGGAAVGKHVQAPSDAGRINDADASVSLNEAPMRYCR